MDYPHTLKHYPAARYDLITPGYTLVFDRAFDDVEKAAVAHAIRQERFFGTLDLRQVPGEFQWAETAGGTSVVQIA